jgi:hypothetical protein
VIIVAAVIATVVVLISVNRFTPTTGAQPPITGIQYSHRRPSRDSSGSSHETSDATRIAAPDGHQHAVDATSTRRSQRFAALWAFATDITPLQFARDSEDGHSARLIGIGATRGTFVSDSLCVSRWARRI